MKQFKLIDFWVSIGLMVSYMVIVTIEYRPPLMSNGYLIQGYFVVGAWQLCSMLVHIFNRKKIPLSPIRTMYHWVALVCIATMPMGLLMLAILLFTAPFLALFYTALCGFELFKNDRPCPLASATTS